MGHKNNRFLQSLRQRSKFSLQLRPRHWIQGAKRLIHQQNRRVRRQRAGHANPLPLPAGKFTRTPVCKFSWIQPYQPEQLAYTCGGAAAAPFFQRWHQPHVFRHCKMRKKSGFLNHITDSPPQSNRIPLRSRAPLHKYLPL